MIELIYIIDILVCLIVLTYRGKKNGILPESFFCLATILSGFGAFYNQFFIASWLISMGFLEANLCKLVAFLLVFVIIRSVLGYLGLVIYGPMRITPMEEKTNMIGGMSFAFIKAVFYSSAALYCLDYLSPSLLTEPIKGSSFVEFFYRLLPNLYDSIFQFLV